jgi:hypothetical protein
MKCKSFKFEYEEKMRNHKILKFSIFIIINLILLLLSKSTNGLKASDICRKDLNRNDFASKNCTAKYSINCNAYYCSQNMDDCKIFLYIQASSRGYKNSIYEQFQKQIKTCAQQAHMSKKQNKLKNMPKIKYKTKLQQN